MSQVTQEQLVASAVAAFDKATGHKNLTASPEEGYYTARQWAAMLGMKSVCNTKGIMDRLVGQNLASHKVYAIGGHKTAHYKMKEAE